MIIMGNTTLPLTPEQQRGLVRQVERNSSAAGAPFPFFLEVLDGQCCSPSARGQLHFTVFSAPLSPQQQRQLSSALIQAAVSTVSGLAGGEPAVIFKPLPARAMALGETLACDKSPGGSESEVLLCIPS